MEIEDGVEKSGWLVGINWMLNEYFLEYCKVRLNVFDMYLIEFGF